MSLDAAPLLDAAAGAETHRRLGTVTRLAGETAWVAGANLRMHELAFVEEPTGRLLAAECTGMRGSHATVSLLDRGTVTAGARLFAGGAPVSAPFGRALLGRIIDGLGRPLDGGPEPWGLRWTPSHAEAPDPMSRTPISEPMAAGVRAIDGFLTLGRGQRIGVFAGSGVGKSTLLGMLARGTSAEVTVIALIGERGREVRDFIEHDLGMDALRDCIVVASTGDNPAAMRLAAANTATAIAEGLRQQGRHVLLLFDSLTRVAMAQREVGLAAGEPPTMRGYPPSVFSLLPHLMERAGPAGDGSITAIYSVLVDGEDMDEPIADIARATLDGHVVLRRALASSGHYPPVDVLQSVSRLMNRVATPEHVAAATRLRSLMAAYEDARDLINIGAYVDGADPDVDAAVQLRPQWEVFLRQAPEDMTPFDETVAAVRRLAGDDTHGSAHEAAETEAQAAPQPDGAAGLEDGHGETAREGADEPATDIVAGDWSEVE